jgi:hypothetical protein
LRGRMMSRWIKTSNRTPTEKGEYLIAQQMFGTTFYDVAYWSNNLSEVINFEDEEYKRGGFYESDSEWGYVECHGVVAWQEIEEYEGEEE